MTKSYLLYKCGEAGRSPLVFFTADSAGEAREAPTWLRRKHPDHPGMHLDPGEFFEIIEQGQCPAEEWDAAIAAIGQTTPTSK
ncbi:MAG: hypothetical protein AB9872_10845 [Solidesulfovibrio sp.]